MRLVWIILWLGFVQAQTFHVGLSTDHQFVIEGELRLENLELRDTKINVRLALQQAVEFGVTMHQTSSFGPVGNIALQGQADVASSGDYQLALHADGVLGSVAANLGGQIFNSLPGDFSIAEAFDDMRPRFSKGSSLNLGVSYRLSRTQVISANPAIYFVDQGFAASLDADYKIYKLFDPNDATFLLGLYTSPVGHSYATLGFQFDLNQKNLPSITAAGYLSLGSQGLLPGVTASLSQKLKSTDAKLGLTLGLEPYRSDFVPYYLTAFYLRDFETGTLEANLYSALATNNLAPITLKVSYAYKF
jgi:hypothetical protein